ncbi:uncharacterized protein LOC129292029 isoform X2 [Prosopis cineraria]|uniref:uncharacterized protein LOC129292029 isoform X2 n=1 Tax=Prosopis cineraria TaxID=364024 RepID=UPI00240EC985|nr:uncharacterized protein LOC129292029 isoform X2 [Prosopis cineraria]
MVMFLSPKSFLLQISLRRNRLKRSSAFFRSASLHSRTRKASSSFSGAHPSKMRRRENKKFLPEEVIWEILLRLTVKSLLRFRTPADVEIMGSCRGFLLLVVD